MRRTPALRRGFTLIEVTIAASILVILTGALVAILGTTLQSWQAGERNREILDNAQFVLHHYFIKDFTALYVDQSSRRHDYSQDPLQYSWMIAEYDANNKKQLRFVRTVPGYSRMSGWGTAAGYSSWNHLMVLPAQNDPLQDQWDTSSSLQHDVGVKPVCAGGLREIAYSMGTDPASTTLFRSQYSAGNAGILKRYQQDYLQPAPAAPYHEAYYFEDLTAVSSISDEILYWDCLFWNQNTLSWNNLPMSPGAPDAIWDSTRGLYANGYNGNSLNQFSLSGPELYTDLTDSLYYRPWQAVFPERIQITLVLRSDNPFAPYGKLAANLGDSDTELRMVSTRYFPAAGFVKIENEWIQYTGISGTRLTGLVRGARNTLPSTHTANVKVDAGLTFVETVDIPGYKEAWNP